MARRFLIGLLACGASGRSGTGIASSHDDDWAYVHADDPGRPGPPDLSGLSPYGEWAWSPSTAACGGPMFKRTGGPIGADIGRGAGPGCGCRLIRGATARSITVSGSGRGVSDGSGSPGRSGLRPA
jgi:hypothetical protein